MTQKEKPMTKGNFEGCSKLFRLDWLFFCFFSGLRSVPEFTFGA